FAEAIRHRQTAGSIQASKTGAVIFSFELWLVLKQSGSFPTIRACARALAPVDVLPLGEKNIYLRIHHVHVPKLRYALGYKSRINDKTTVQYTHHGSRTQ